MSPKKLAHIERVSLETNAKATDEQRRLSMVAQLIDYLNLEFGPCLECEGTGEQDSWIPTCQKCYGVGRRLRQKDSG
jgi:hypothetical protein